MRRTASNHALAFLAVAVGAVAVLSGCSKKEVSTPPAPVAETTPASAATADVQAAVPVNISSADIAKVSATAETALKSKEYDKAAEAILAVQRQKQLTDEQAATARNQMVRLQSELAGAVASGDPRAKAAAEMLRQSAMQR